MGKYKVDKNLFIYITKSTGHTLGEAAAAMGLKIPGLSRRLNGFIPFKVCECEAWMKFVGVTDAGPIFFPGVVADKQHEAEEGDV